MREPNIPALYREYQDSTVLDKSRRLAQFTLPNLLRAAEEDLSSQDQSVVVDYQSVGAVLVNSLAAKIAELLFPSTRPFATFAPPEDLLGGSQEQTNELNQAMIPLQEGVADLVRLNSGTAIITVLLKHLIVHGNPVLYRDVGDSTMRVYPVDTISMRRDGRGKVIDCIIREVVAQQLLPDEVRALYLADQRETTPRELYTRIKYDNELKGYYVTQVVGDHPDKIIGTAYYPDGTCPWIFPVWNLRQGDHYARGLVEDYSADFAKLSMASESSALYLQEALRVIHLVQGGGATVDDVQNAECGDAVADPSSTGGGVQGYEVGDYNKVLQARDEIATIVQRLSSAFMYQGNVRDSERTTAEEIRTMAREVERSLGGPYASLSASLQVPLAKLLLTELDASLIPDVVNNVLSIRIVAGIDALGRTAEATQLLTALSECATALQTLAVINEITNILDPNKVAETIFTANGVSIGKYSKSEEVIKQEAEAQKEAMLAEMQQGQGQPVGPAAEATADINQLLG